MKTFRTFLACLPGLVAVPLFAQPQIGGGTCSTATLSGNYSATLTGRAFNTALAFSSTSEAVGSVNFDGLSKVIFTLTTNTNKTFNTPQTLSGTYTLQANCVGAISNTSGDVGLFTLESYNQGKSYFIAGQDGLYQFTGSGGTLPTTCPVSLTAGNYPINGTGFGITSGALSSTFNILGVIQLSGANTIAMNIFVAANGSTKNISATGSYTVMSNCVGTATLTDSSGANYTLSIEFTNASGESFILASASPSGLFTATGRSL